MKEEWKKMDKRFKALFITLSFLSCCGLLLSLTGCGYGPSKEYVIKMDKRAAKHFPRYKQLIKNATKEQLIKSFNTPQIEKLNKSRLERFKKIHLMEIDGWHDLIKAEKELLQEKK